jgi:hypothetical protein
VGWALAADVWRVGVVVADVSDGSRCEGRGSLVRGLWMFLREMCLCLEVSSLNRPVEQRGALYHGVW